MKENDFLESAKRALNLEYGLPPGVLGIGDDCAVLPYNEEFDLLATCDTLVLGTHFTLDATPSQVAHKLFAVNLSDIASMGGVPLYALLSLTVPNNLKETWLQNFLQALSSEAKTYSVPVVGGDTVGGSELSLSLFLLGKVEKGKALLRSGAKVGDLVLVTGELGGTLESQKHLNFSPRLKEAILLKKFFAPTAMMDLSDGLAEDGARLALASGVSLFLDSEKIPVRVGVNLEEALTGGEDFELLFTISPQNYSKDALEKFYKEADLKLTVIGCVEASKDEPFFLDQKPFRKRGYAHFRI